MKIPVKPSESELNHVFLYRKKTIPYRRIPQDSKKILKEEFDKVFFIISLLNLLKFTIY